MNADTRDDLLGKVHRRIGGLGFDIQTFGGQDASPRIEARWRRDYGGEWSEERQTHGDGFAEVLQAILDYEDEADRVDEEAA